MISLNNDTRLPEFDGVIFNPKTKNDDDEFIEIEEKYDADNITTYNKIKRSNYNSSDIQNNDKPDKKKIEDLFDLLDDKPKSFEVNNISSKQPVGDLYSNINMNTNHNNEQHKIGSQILNRMEVNVNNANQSLNFNTLNQPVTYEEDDEFVEIEENNHVYTPTEIRQTENISYYVDNNMTTLNSIGNAENIDKGNLNNIKFNLDSNLSIANNESCVHEEKQVDFQKILLDSNFQPQKKKEDEFINDKNILTASNNFNSEENIKTYEMISNSNKKTLDDLLNTVDIDWNANNNKNIENLDKKDQIQDNFLTITFNTPVESNTENFVDKNNNQAGKDNQDKIDDKIYNINNFIINNTNINEKQQYDNEEFCEVEENTEDHDPNEKQHTANDNLLFELDFINQTGKKNGIAPPLDEDIQHIAEDKPNMTTQHNKVSIINYTQDDFLNEFKKEQHLENKNDNDANDDFEFTSVVIYNYIITNLYKLI